MDLIKVTLTKYLVENQTGFKTLVIIQIIIIQFLTNIIIFMVSLERTYPQLFLSLFSRRLTMTAVIC